MLGVFFDGRLGNQLFQYAFVYAQAKKRNKKFFFSLEHFPSYRIHYFNLRYGRVEVLVNRIYSALFRVFYRSSELQIQYGDESTEAVLQQAQDFRLFRGYFQSERFFSEASDEIKSAFTIRKKYVRRFEEKYGELFRNNKVAVIHVRRTDYIQFGNQDLGVDLTLPHQYYQNFFSSIDLEPYKIVVISDDLDEAKKVLCNHDDIRYEANDEIIDFQLLMNADLLCISNSSFAWWAAYLNKKQDKIVFSPKYWLGFKVKRDFPVDIHLEEWKQIDC
jgi:hypothetical protein